jgi:DNA-directed RNA polymerase subunit M/transcription elongation factor TFIIS
MSPAKKSIACPKCDDDIPIPVSKEDTVKIICSSCGAKGKVSNPYSGPDKPSDDLDIEDILDEDEINLGDKEDSVNSDLSESIDCPKCSAEIIVPLSADLEIIVECKVCGAKGKVPNPYIEDESSSMSSESGSSIEEYIECPKCNFEIGIPYSEDERIIIQCNECGAMGRINNPHLMGSDTESIDLESHGIKTDLSETALENDHNPSTHGILETISCPRCNETISVPYSNENKLKVHCDSCGAKGKILNPYM